MIKIIVTGTRGFPGIQGGVESHCENLYTHLVRQGCDITVFTRKSYVQSEFNEYKGINLISVDCPQQKILETIVHTFKCVLKARTLHPDILHIHAIGPSLFTPFARLLGMKVVVTNHGADYKRKKWPLPAKLFLRFCEMMGMIFANKVITIAENIAEDMRNKFGRDSVVLPNGVEIHNLTHTDDILKKYGIERRKYILAVGRFVPEKGFDDLIKAFDRVQLQDWKLVIAGDADHEDDYSRSLKRKAGKNQSIIFTGFMTSQPLCELYSFAGLFVIPSYHEGLPIVLLEAMSYGLSCIASNIPANKNVELEENRFFKVGDIELLAKKIKEYACKPWNEEDRKREINMIAENYNWNKIAGETLKVYKQIMF